MQTRRTVLLLCLVASIPLLACALPIGPGPRATREAATAQAIAAVETEAAATVYAVQTAEAPTPTPTATSTPTSTPTPTPMPTATPTQTPTPGPLSAVEILERVSPALVFIDTPAGTASGILIEDGYVVTNAHAVWPFKEVRVVFPDGTERATTPVLGWDLLADLAVIGPLPTGHTPLALVDGERLVIGSDVFQVGYPAEMERYPQPTISRGVLSRLRQWNPIGMTFFQTDATTVGGQSGGALVSDKGEVIGITSYRFTDGFGLAASAADVLPRAQRLIAGEDVSGLGDRGMPTTAGRLEHDVVLANYWSTRMFVVNEPVGTEVEITVDGENDASFGIYDVQGGSLVYVDDGFTGIESGTATTRLRAPHFLVVEQFSGTSGDFAVRSNCTLAPYHDRDDGITVSLNQTISASIDYPFDIDHFSILLAAGDTIAVEVDSLLIDPVLTIDFPGAAEEQMIVDDDSGGGLFGLSAKITYRAPHSGRYYIVVQDSWMSRMGGYVLRVSEAPRGAAAVSPPPAPTGTPTPDWSKVVLTTKDLPEGFQEAPSGMFDAWRDNPFLEELQGAAFGFADEARGEVIFGYTMILADETQQVEFDEQIRTYLRLMMTVITAAASEDAEDPQEMPDLQIGDASAGMTAQVQTEEGGILRVQGVMFRRGEVGAFLLAMQMTGEAPAASIVDLARTLDERIVAALE